MDGMLKPDFKKHFLLVLLIILAKTRIFGTCKITFVYLQKQIQRHRVAKQKESKNEVSNFIAREAKHQERNRRRNKCRVVENTICANLKRKK